MSDTYRPALGARRLVSNTRRLTQSAIGALVIGMMLGALVAVPYDQVFGFSAPLCTALRSSIATAILAGIRATDGTELAFVTHQTAYLHKGRE